MHTTPRATHTSTGIFTSIKLYIILLLSLLLVSGGAGGSGGDGGPVEEFIENAESTISLNVTKGPVAKANCMLTDAAGNTITSTTNSNGLFVTTSKIAVGALTIACSGGSYTDEATGSVIDAPTMHAVGYHSGNDFSATVSPLSEIAYQRAIALVGMENIASLSATVSATVSDEHKKIATLFGLEGIDILKTVPTPLVGTDAETATNDDAGKFAVLLAGLSQLFVNTYGTATQVTQGIKALATDLADGTFDDKEKLITAIEDFDAANKDSLNYDDTIVEDLTQAIGSATTTVTEVAAPVISLTTGESISYTVGDTITPLVFNSTATNGGATECSISALPPGLQLNGTTLLSTPATSSGTCELTGTLTTASPSTEYILTVGNVRATDSATIDIIVNKIEQAPLSVPSRLTTATFGDTPLTVSAEGGSTDGEVSATNSSNTNVATVSGTQISITGAGDTTITLTKAGDDNYLPVTTTYTLTVVPTVVSGVATITAQVGANNSTMQIVNPTSSAYTAYLSKDTYCDPENSGATCDDTQIIPAYQTTEFTSTALTLSNSTFGILQNTLDRYGEFSISLEDTSFDKFSKIQAHQVVEMNGDLYLIGGHDGSRKNDVWKSTDNGQNWLEISPHNANDTTKFTPRYYHQVVVKDDVMYLIGGFDKYGYKNDVWKSTNGETWTQVKTSGSIFTPRGLHQVVVKGDAMYLIGGHDKYGSKNDVWKSTNNGKIWVEILTHKDTPNDTQFSPRTAHQVVVKGDAMYLIGGWIGTDEKGSPKNDVWKSTDNGRNWLEILAHTDNPDNTQFTPREGHQVVVKDNALYVIGGNDGLYKNDIWKSSNGITWTLVEPSDDIFIPRLNHQVVVKDGVMYLIGGWTTDGRKNDIWKSTNGETWQLVTNGAEFTPRNYHQVVEMNGELYLIGGGDGSRKNDIWKSADTGKTWTQVKTTGNIFTPRRKHQVVAKDDTLYVIGGFDDSHKNDVWKSSNKGVTWTRLIENAAFPARDAHQVVVIDGTMYLIGGWIGDSGRSNDIWQSTNGESWTQVTLDDTSSIFSARYGHQVVTINDVMYLIGGNDNDDSNKNDIWKSTDTGKTWTQVKTTGDIFAPRRNHQVVVTGSTMYLIGGTDGSKRFNDVWRSTDQGVTWEDISVDTNSNTTFAPRQGHQVVVVDDTMLVIAGSDGSYKNDVWSSTDGSNWFLHVQVAVTLKKDQPKLSNTGATSATFGDAPLEIKTTGGNDAAAVSASSSNTDVAQVVDGKIVITGVGTTTITISKAGDANYYETSDTYTLTVTPRIAQITAQVGANDSTMQITNPTSSAYTAYLSQDIYCDPENSGSTCDDTQIIPANDSIEFTPPALTLSTPTFGILQNILDQYGEFSIAFDKFSERQGHQIVEMNGDLYLIGGRDDNSIFKNDVWKSTNNGQTWIEISPQTNANDTTKFTPRHSHQVVVKGDVMYLIGGRDDSYKNDIWKSTNGETWERVETTGEIFTPRWGHQVVVKGEDIYLIGGYDDNDGYKNDIWKSSNGITWTQVETSGEIFTPREGHQVVVKGGAMYLIGGHDGLRKNDVWKSTNGANWQPVETSGEIFTPRLVHQVVVKGGAMYLIGGYDGSEKNDVWKSTDGANWERVEPSDEIFTPRWDHQAIVKDDAMYVIGGRSITDGLKNDVWKSSDNGESWTELKSELGSAEFTPRDYHQVVEMNGELYLIGGDDGSRKNDVWKSSDTGKTWTQVKTTGNIFTPRRKHQVVAKDDTLYVIGGFDDSHKNDVWKSIDKGVTWTRLIENAAFPARDAHQVVVIDNTMYLIGGWIGDSGRSNDIWESTDGESWTQVTLDDTSSIFSARYGHQVVVTGSTMYLIGGNDGTNKNDIWRSIDTGVTWAQVETTGDIFAPRRNHQVVVTGSTMYLIGGTDDSRRFNDVWRSTDQGVTWEDISAHDANSNTKFAPRQGHQVVVVGDGDGDVGDNGTILVIGGSDGSTEFNDVWSSTDGSNWFLHVQVAVTLKKDQPKLSNTGATTATFGDAPLEIETTGGNDAAAVRASSSNTDVAQVVDGRIIITGAGTTTITLTKAGDANYHETSDTYTLTVFVPNMTKITAQVGANDSTMQIVNPTSGEYTVYLSKDTYCDPENSGATCDDTQIIPAYDSIEFTSTALTLSTPTFGILQNTLDQYGEFSIAFDKFSKRLGHQVVEMNGDLYLIGGYDGSRKNDVWKSTDNGRNWLEISPHNANDTTKFTPRYYHQVVVKDDVMYLIGGFDKYGYKNDVWKSTNGETWTQVKTSGSIFTPRDLHQVVVKGDAMYLIGGYDKYGYKNDVWKSTNNGKIWVEILTHKDTPNDTQFSPRTAHQVVVKGDAMYLIGGWIGTDEKGSPKNDVWKSTDNGRNWLEILAHTDNPDNTQFTPREGHQVVVKDNALYVIGGNDGLYKNDIWKSSNGITWTLVEPSDDIFIPRLNHQVVVKDGVMYLIGGYDGFNRFSDIWKATNGETWQLVTNGAEFTPRNYHQVVEMNGELYLIGGDDGSRKNDVWKSSDTGKTWTQVKTTGNIFTPRRKHQVVAKDDTLYVIGGFDDSHKNDVWKSSNKGVTWTRLIENAAFPARDAHQVVVIDGTMYLIGGWIGDSGRSNDIWQSTNGESWTQVTLDDTSSIFSARYGHQVVTINDVMYLIGGNDNDDSNKNDIWKSTDTGKTWTQVKTTGDIFAPRRNHQVVVTGSTMYLIGGTDGSKRFNDVWRSTDQGVTWEDISVDTNSNTTFAPRQGHQVVVVDDTMLVIAGSDGSYKNDVWSSTDGSNWFLHVQVAVTLKKDQPKLSNTGATSATFGDAPLEIKTTGGNDAAAVSASSSNTDVAQVVDGKIVITGVGTTTITISKAGDANYYETSDTYTLTVTPRIAQITAQVGANDSTMQITNPTSSAYTAYLSQDIYCDPENSGATCDDTEIIPANDSIEFTPTALTLSTPTFGILQNTLDQYGEFSISFDKFSKRDYHQIVEMNGDLYLIGGRDDNSILKNDVWKSTNNGQTWIEISPQTNANDTTKFTPRHSHQVVVKGDVMYLIGGLGRFIHNDIWKSTNGITWERVETSGEIFTPREGHQVVVKSGYMYLIGGRATSGLKNDVWESSNGITWTQVETTGEIFTPRSDHQVVVKDDVMYLIGGYDGLRKNDVWKSTNGANWQPVETSGEIFTPRLVHQVVVKGGAMYLIGGYDGSEKNDVWKSTDNGQNWVEILSHKDNPAPEDNQFTPRWGHQVVVKDDAMYVIGGRSTTDGLKNDVWKSTNGETWQLVTNGAEFTQRDYHQVVEMNGELYLIGGDDDSNKNDIWKSADTGKTWTQVKTTGEIFSPRRKHQVVATDDTLYVIGGNDGSRKNDVWKSIDKGVTWTRLIRNAAFPARDAHQVVVIDNTMYLIGGWTSNSVRSNDIWQSTNGESWTQVTPDDPNSIFSARYGHQVVTINDVMYLIGGNDGSLKNDVWKSSDTGVTWVQVETTGEIFAPRRNHQVVVMGSTMYLIGGTDGSKRFNDVWRSTDQGVTWEDISVDTNSNTTFAPRQGHQVVVVDDTMLVIAGSDGSYKNDVWSSTDGSNWFLHVQVAVTLKKDQPKLSNAGATTTTFGDAPLEIETTGGNDAAAVRASSSNTDVAQVVDGRIIITGAGTTTITLTKAGNANYYETSDTYTLTVFVPNITKITAQLGAHSSTMQITNPTSSAYTAYLSQDIYCDPENSGATCDDTQIIPAYDSIEFTSTALTLSTPTFGILQNTLDQYGEFSIAFDKFSKRLGHQVVEMNGDLYLIGGYDGSRKNDVWKSTDNGRNWLEISPHNANDTTKFTPRYYHQVIVKDDAMYLIGGFDKYGYKNDVWKSTNGANWERVKTSGSIFTPRGLHQVVVKGGAMYLIGGNDGLRKNDVWKSSNGITWTQVETTGDIFTPRGGHQVIVKGDVMYLIGGNDDNDGEKNDIWKSTNGANWQPVEPSGDIFTPRERHQVVVKGGAMYLIGGYDYNDEYRNDVWESTDNGKNWREISLHNTNNNAKFTPRNAHQAIVKDDVMYVIGGRTTDGRKNDIWKSTNGETWQLVTNGAEFTPRNYHQVVEMNGDLYLIGGDDGSRKNDVWKSSDTGKTWTQILAHTDFRDNIQFPPRRKHQVIAKDDTLYVIGGNDGSHKNDVWKSSNKGVTWTRLIENAAFPARDAHQVVVIDGTMYLIGGWIGDSGRSNDIWESTDGESWTQVTPDDANSIFSARYGHQVVTINDVMYLIGGNDDSNKNDIWKSENQGVTWAQVETTGEIFAPRRNHQVVVMGSTMYLIGGTDGSNRFNDVWRSTDQGVTWEDISVDTNSNTTFAPRQGHQVVVVDDTMLVIGGSNGSYKNDVWSSTDGSNWFLHVQVAFTLKKDQPKLSNTGATTATFGDAPLEIKTTGGNDTAAVNANSSNTDVAQVVDGRIVITGAGTTTITISKAGDANYHETSDTYTLTVTPRIAQITAQVGANDSTMQITNPTSIAYTAYLSQDIYCDPENSGATCDDTQIIPANDSIEFTPPALTLSTPTFGILQNTLDQYSEFSIALEDMSFDKFSKRQGHQIIEMNGDLYLIGGNDGSYKNDVWKSSDNGQNWLEISPHDATDTNKFTPRWGHQVVVLGEYMYLIGGFDKYGYKNDVWKSTNGANWERVKTSGSIFTPRVLHQVVVKGGAMYLIGGNDGLRKNDVWKSTDNGRNWLEISPHNANDTTKFTPRYYHQVIVKDDAMYLIGGYDYNDGDKNDIWKSTNGANWQPVEPSGEIFTPRYGHQVVVKGGAMYLIGGYDYNDEYKNDVWESTDNGKNWREISLHNANDTTKFTPRYAHRVIVKDDAMYLIGGYNDSYKNDVWKSSDNGESWTELKSELGSAEFTQRDYHQVVEMNGELYLIGGGDDSNKNDIWKSADTGKTWTQVKTTGEIFSPRHKHQVVAKDDTLYVIGGYDDSHKNDVWKSTDKGITWTRLIENAAFPARDAHQVVVIGDTMYLIGGWTSNSGRSNDIWQSTDGESWTQVTPDDTSSIFSARYGHQVVTINDVMYLIGGNDGTNKNDIWKSSDTGVTWAQVTPTVTIFTPRTNHQVVVTGSTMYLIGGTDGSKRFNDVWRSTDQGVTWEDISAHDANSNTVFAPREGHQVVVVGDNDTMLVIAGSDGSYKNDVWSSTDGSNWFLHVQVAVTLKKDQPKLSNTGATSATFGDAPLEIKTTGGNDAAAVSASSSNTDVAQVVDGKIVITGVGTTIITLTKASDANYYETSDTYTLTVFVPNITKITAQVGANDSTMQITNPTSIAYTVYLSKDTYCDPENSGATCDDTEIIPAYDSIEFTPPALTLSTPTFGILQNILDQYGEFSIAFDKFSERQGHQIVEMNGDLYLIGGYDGSRKNDVWKSSDNGQTWLEISPHNANDTTKFTPRYYHQVVVKGSAMYLIGGNDGSYKNDVWKSTDQGVTWQPVTPTGGIFSARENHQVVVKGGYMYLIAGYDGSRKNDIWKSTNGESWTKVPKPDNLFDERYDHQVVVKGDYMYLIGGRTLGGNTNGVWRSTNGESWTRISMHNVNNTNKFTPRTSHQVVVLGEYMYVIGGSAGSHFTSSYANDVWKSKNGETWEQVKTAGTIFTRRDNHQVIVNGDTMYLIGGDDGSRKNDVWKSKDGETWQSVTNGAEFTPRNYHQVVEMNGELYLIGGDDGSRKNDVWKSSDTGKTWTQILAHTDLRDNTQFPPRRKHQVVVKGDDMYLIGGFDGSHKNDVWKSSNKGVTWTRLIRNAAFPARDAHQVVVIDNTMYLIGGWIGDSGRSNDIWESTDGKSWTQVTLDDTSSIFSARYGHQVVVKGSTMYLIGGNDGTNKNDIWRSIDTGVTWAQVETTGDIFAPRRNHQVVVTGSTMYLIGGTDDSKRFNDVWRSTDQGVTWEDISAHDANSNTKFAPRQGHQVVVVGDGDGDIGDNGTILVIGGSDGSTEFNDVWSSTDGSNWFLHVQVAVTLKKDQPKLSNTGATTATFGDAPLEIETTGGTGAGAVNASSSNTDVAQVVDGRIVITGVGTTTITISKAGDANYYETSDTYTLTINRTKQAALSNPTPTTATFGDAPLTVSAEGGSGNGTITATSSSNTNVAEVSGGKVVIKGAGTTTITITKAGDANYYETSDTYTLTVLPPNVATITAQVGANDSTMQITNPTSGEYTVYLSKDTYCDPENSGATCDDTEIIPAYDSIEFTPTALTLNTPTFGILQNTLDQYGEFSIAFDKFSKRSGHQIVEMNGDLYLIGGGDGSRKNDVWKSSDNGQTWLEISPQTNDTTKFTPRWHHQVVVKDGAMYLIGGLGRFIHNDIWKSTNGITWERVETSGEIFTPRGHHQVVVKGGAMYLIGGYDYNGKYKNDVWKSSNNGQTWVEISPDNANDTTKFTPRYSHQVVVLGEDMYLIGGLGRFIHNDIWKSTNGITWELVETSGEIFTPRGHHQVVVKDDDNSGAMYLIGGYDGSLKNDVWKSSDGKDWERVETSDVFAPRQGHQVVAIDGTMFVIGGHTGGNNDGLKNDVWKSKDGETWQLVTNGSAEFTPREYHQVVEMNGELYLIGGGDDSNKNDIWKSADTGKTWTQVETTGEIFSPRRKHQVVAKDDTLYVIGGYDDSRKNDVWKSTDKGVTWEQLPNDNPFPARDAHQVVVIGDTMYLIGGWISDSERSNDIWQSTDGESWTQVTPTDPSSIFSARYGHQVVTINDVMYLIGGNDDSNKNDIWESSDTGVTWAQVETTGEIFAPRRNHQIVVTGSTMYLIGGTDGSKTFNDVWRSTDQGVTWEDISAHDANSNTKFAPRQGHQVVVVGDGDGDIGDNGTILVIGGSDDFTEFNDVWSSTDGSNWFLHVKTAIPLD